MTDFDNFSNASEDALGLEKMTYSRFYANYVIRRPALAPTHFDDWNSLQLPNDSVLHTLNGFDSLVAQNNGMPDPTIPLVTNEKLPIFLKIHRRLADEHSLPFGTKDVFTFRGSTLVSGANRFYQENRKYKPILSDRTLGTLHTALTWIDYSPLNEVMVSGTLHAYRKFDLLFRTMLNSVAQVGGGQHHYILLPQSSHVFSRAQLIRSFSELTTSSLNLLSQDPSIFPIIHLLAFVYGKKHPLKVTPYKEDVRLLGKDSPIFNEVTSTSLLERIPQELYPQINFIIQKDDKAAIYNLADLAHFAEDAAFFMKLYRHVMNLRLMESAVADHIDKDSEQFDNLVTTISGDDTPVTTENTLVVKDEAVPEAMPSKLKAEPVPPADKPASKEIKPVIVVDDIPITKPTEDIGFEEKVRKVAKTVVPATMTFDEKVDAKRNTLIENHFNAMIGGKTLGELIHQLPPQVIAPKQMDFVKSAPEAAYKSSSLIAMDRTYQQYAYHHEMAKTIASLAKHGLYVTKIDEDHVHTEMDRTTTYKVSLQDLTGKPHHVKFTVPTVDSNGLMKLSGIDYRLTRQIANIPICKISPTRVNLSSYYNKVIVERIQSKRNSYEHDIRKLIVMLGSEKKLTYVAGIAPLPTESVAFDYTSVGRSFTEITVDGYIFSFDGNGADPALVPHVDKEHLTKLKKKYGCLTGYSKNKEILLFWDKANQIHAVKADDTIEKSWRSFHHFLVDRLGRIADPEKITTEWTQAKIINQKIPLVFILAYKFGIKAVFDMIKLDYRFYPNGTRAQLDTMDISIRFADGTLVFNRYPLSRSLIASGLTWVPLKDINFSDMYVPEVYGRILQKKGMSVGVLKGISGFFDFFVDPMTESVLQKMREPTTFHELLLRANIMLTDFAAEESSSIALHRFRLYERFNGIIYNQIYSALANHRNNPTSKKSFSINPEAVFIKIVTDATMSPNDVINPVHEVKQLANFTFTGGGGRDGDSFVMNDRVYPKDGLGVISDAVPDSGKVGITSYLSASPRIDDIHGIPKPYKPGDNLDSPQILSIGSMVMPGGTIDDGKRNSYLSIQISHYVPNHEDGETLAVRTGYDEVLPHLTSDTFSVAARDSGVVEAIDEKYRVIRVRYADKQAVVLRTLKVPYIDSVINQYRQDEKSFGLLIPESDIGQYPVGGVFSITKTTNAKIADRLRCDTVDAIPDNDAIKKQNNLIQDFLKGRYKALYYIRLTPISPIVPGEIKCYTFADIHTPISGAYLLQKRVANVKVGDTFKEGDILAYNPGFFAPDPLSKQVTFKHGVIATVALIEKSSNHEDACEISRDLADRLKMTPCHQREIVTKADAAVLRMVKVGDHVETSDSLCIISDEYLISTSLNPEVENIDLMEKLNRQTPAADYTGTIRKIRILYACDREQLSDSLKVVLKVYEKEVRDNFRALNPDPNAKLPERPGWVNPGTKYHGVMFTPDTVVLEFMIEEELGVAEGDKLCFGNANKSIVSNVAEQQHFTESGIPVDALFSTTSIINRIVASPFMIGLNERIQETLKKKCLDIYFDED